MEDEDVTEPIFKSTRKAGFEGVTWMDAGSRSFYTVNREINTPEDLKGLKIRVQQSPSNVEMMNRFGGSATPMNFGEVYTALQSGVNERPAAVLFPSDMGTAPAAGLLL